jgi:hypothetical protein
MVQFGIFRVEDYCPDAAGILGRLRTLLTKDHISFQLLQTSNPAKPREVALFEAIMKQMKLADGVYRTTFRGRLRDLDAYVNDLLAQRFASETPLDVHDWAASDCLTSAEWAPSLFERFPNSHLQASDLTLFLVEVGLPGGDAFILQQAGEPLQYLRAPFVIRLDPPELKVLVLNRILARQARVKLAWMKARLSIPADWLDSTEIKLTVPPFHLRKLPVIHPDAEALRSRDRRFSIERHSVFAALNLPVDIIRSMNIFNRIYFQPERLTDGTRAVWHSLKPGGLWISGRTWQDHPPAHNVSILEKTRAGFRSIGRFGDGSEIESLALGFNPADDRPLNS